MGEQPESHLSERTQVGWRQMSQSYRPQHQADNHTTAPTPSEVPEVLLQGPLVFLAPVSTSDKQPGYLCQTDRISESGCPEKTKTPFHRRACRELYLVILRQLSDPPHITLVGNDQQRLVDKQGPDVLEERQLLP